MEIYYAYAMYYVLYIYILHIHIYIYTPYMYCKHVVRRIRIMKMMITGVSIYYYYYI